LNGFFGFYKCRPRVIGLPARLAEADGRTPPKPLATEREAQAGRQGIQKYSLVLHWFFV